MKRVPEETNNENQTIQQRKSSEANRKVQFNNEIEALALFKGKKPSKSEQKPGISSLVNRLFSLTVQYQPGQIP